MMLVCASFVWMYVPNSPGGVLIARSGTGGSCGKSVEHAEELLGCLP